ncbi:helix-hairpin-helix domain-containing protein, partial [Escherichia coli]|uniref:helix-hairpin-helix domain-containing protein n=1 Tax=Escherichia coli TaxID=562 RepID=UPI0034D341F3
MVRDAKNHGVEIRPIDINHSRWDCTLEPTRNRYRLAARLGLRMIRGLHNSDAAMIPLARDERPFTSIEDLWRRAGIPVSALE